MSPTVSPRIEQYERWLKKRRSGMYRDWFMKRIRENPKAHLLFIDNPVYPLWWFKKGDFVTLSHLMKEIGCGFKNMLRILGDEEVHVSRVPAGNLHYRYVERKFADDLILKHGSSWAREQRMRAYVRTKLPINTLCHHCGKHGKQWRLGLTSDGRQRVRCGHCMDFYVLFGNPRPAPLQSTCPHCGATANQIRKQIKCGKRGVWCRPCGKYYSMALDPPPPADPPLPIRSRTQLAETVEETKQRWARGPSQSELNEHADRLLFDLEQRSARLEANLRARQSQTDEEMREVTRRNNMEFDQNMARARPARPFQRWWRKSPYAAWRDMTTDHILAIFEQREPKEPTTLDKLRRLAAAESTNQTTSS